MINTKPYPTIEEIQKQIVQEFSVFENPMDKYEYLIDVGKQLPELNPLYKTDENLVKGCQSKVWLHSYTKDGRVIYEADSNTVITKGLIALLVRVLSNQKPEDIVKTDLEFIDKIDLKSHLSSQRTSGLAAMIKHMKAYAMSVDGKHQ
ncbi:MAG TPA: SufE family protein [Chitinophagales bacterium]|nr:SufE family protein [Chitinophagales bacterium]